MISGRSFAEICKWVFDPRYPNAPRYSRLAANGDRVFINGDYVMEFAKMMPRIPLKRHVFIVHNSDQPFDNAKFRALLPFAVHIYAVNNVVIDPRVTTIPLGFADKQLAWASSFAQPAIQREIFAYANFIPHTNASKRNQCLDAVRDDPRVTLRSNLTNEEYHEDLSRSEFVLCPEGTGADTHRFYEALLCGATPVVLRNSLTSFYSRYPICVVDRWSDPYVRPPSTSVEFRAESYIR
jgi:hypothetical protein